MTEELKVYITAEISKLKSELDKGKKEVEDFGKKGKVSFQEFNDGFQQVGDAAKKGLAVAGAAIAGAATALLALGNSTKEYRVAQAKLNTAFEAAGSTAGVAKDVYNDLYRTIGDTDVAVEAANHLAKLSTNQKDLSEWTNICQGIYATFGDSLPIEGLTEAANETARVGQVTGPLADALNWAGVSEDEFNEKLLKCANTQEREALIRTTLNGLYEEAAAGYEENAAEVLAANEAQEKLNAKMAELGEAMAPINTMLATFASEILAQITPFLTDFAEKHGPTIKQVLSDVATAIGEVISFIVDNWETIKLIATIVGSIAIAIVAVSTALSIYNTIQTIVNATMWACPITWIIAAIVALIAAIILCVVYWDEIKAAILKFAEAVMNVLGKAWDWLVNLFTTIINWISEKLIKPIINYFKDLWNGIVNGFNTVIGPWIEIIKRAAIVINDTVIKPIKEKFDAMVKWFKENIIGPISNFFTKMWDGLSSGAKKAWSGIVSVFSPIINWFKDKFTQAWTAVKNVFSVGGKIFDGIKEGIANVFKTVVNGIIGGINKVIAVPFNAINKMLNKLRSLEILGVKPFSWINTFNVPQIPKLAKGGIIDSATLAVVGESGKEAVVPLENNLEWLDKLADRLAAKTGGSTPVVLNVDGKTFAQTSISTINELTRQTGSLKLNIM